MLTVDARSRCSTCRRVGFLLQTMRSHDQFNTTIYGLDDRYRGVKGGRRVVFVNPDDMRALGLAEGDLIDLVERVARRRRAAWRGPSASSPTTSRAGARRPTTPRPTRWSRSDSTAEKSNQPVYKSIVVRLDRAGEGGRQRVASHGSPDQGCRIARDDDAHHLS